MTDGTGKVEEETVAEQRYVVVGGGLAGAKAVEALRESEAAGPVTLVGDEAEAPYERPPLSKEFLKGDKKIDDFRALAPEWYADHDVELLTGERAVRLDRDARTVELKSGASLPYDRLLLATGAHPRKLRVPGADDAPLHYLRRLSNSTRLRDELAPGGRRVVIVGAGWIGLEVAAAARGYGNEVTAIEFAANPLERALGAEVGAVFARVHREEGVDLRTGVGVESFETGAGGTVVVDSGGGRHEADVVVVGAGIKPAVELGADAGLEVARGLLADASMRTSDPAVWVAGDAAEAYHPYLGRHLHVEHWAFALNSGKAAGQSMAGQDVTYDRVPYFFTDQYDVGMEFSGTTDSYDRVVFRGSSEGREFVAFWLEGDRVVAGMNVNVWDVVDPIQALVRAGAAGTGVDVARLTDPSVPLDQLLPAR